MPRQTLRALVGHKRTRRANRQLGLLLAFVAGAINAGGVLAIQRDTSHMTGIVSGAADDLALGRGGLALAGVLLVVAAAVLLCFILGLQNAMVTKRSQAEARTTPMTGVITDLGIELGKLLYWSRSPETPDAPMVRANRDRLRLHATLLACFAGGGLVGALTLQALGFYATLPIALLLAALAAVPIIDDLQAARAG